MYYSWRLQEPLQREDYSDSPSFKAPCHRAGRRLWVLSSSSSEGLRGRRLGPRTAERGWSREGEAGGGGRPGGGCTRRPPSRSADSLVSTLLQQLTVPGQELLLPCVGTSPGSGLLASCLSLGSLSPALGFQFLPPGLPALPPLSLLPAELSRRAHLTVFLLC